MSEPLMKAKVDSESYEAIYKILRTNGCLTIDVAAAKEGYQNVIVQVIPYNPYDLGATNLVLVLEANDE